MIWLSLFLSMAAAASVESISTIVSVDAIDNYPLSSPWAVATSKTGVVFYSNFGPPYGRDFIAYKPVGGSPKVLDGATLADVKKIDSSITAMHVKALTVANDTAETVYAAVYGGPAPAKSYILACQTTSKCLIVYIMNIKEGTQLMPTSIAYSGSRNRVYFAMADGGLKASFIASVAVSGTAQATDYQVYMSQTQGMGCDYPVAVAVDDTNQLMFWANDIGANKIQQGKLDINSANVGTILRDSARRPEKIAVDPVGRFVYFTDQTSTTNYIGRVRFGTGSYDSDYSQLTSTPKTPSGIAINIEKQELIWGEVGTSTIKQGKVSDINVAPPSAKKSSASSLVGSLSLALVACAVANQF